ncbi:hypothetical protein FRC12_013567, partial [Ceratobasidium sp. 428]
MNTLGYISRQYDALASQPTTPTSETPPQLLAPRLGRSQDDSDILRLGRNPSPKLHRTKSLSRTRPAAPIALDSAPHAADTHAAEPSSEDLATPLLDNTTASEPVPAAPAPAPPLRARRKRFILIRLLISLWHGLCSIWSLLPAWKRVRHNFGLLALDEKEDDDNDDELVDEPDSLVTRAPLANEKQPERRISFDSSQVLAKRTSRSRFGKPPTPVVSSSELAESDQDARDDPDARTGTRTRSLSL